jgi:glucose-1-phosphate thymidylyltransferase
MNVGVIPAAGHATRLQPLPCSKEMLPIGGRPVIDYVVERVRAVPGARVRVVTRPDKADVVAHAEWLGAEIVLGEPPTLAASVALGARGLTADDVALIGLPDTIWEPVDGFASLLGALDPAIDVVVGVFESDEPERSDVVVLGDDDRVIAVDVKPERPRSRLVWGCAATRAPALAGLERHGDVGEHFDVLAHAGRVRAVRFPGRLVDVGTPAALRQVLAAAEASA